MFKILSEINPGVKKSFKASFGLISWDEVCEKDKEVILQHLKTWFSNDIGNYPFSAFNENGILYSIDTINRNYKKLNFSKNYLSYNSIENAKKDFKDIFLYKGQNIFIEMIGLYIRGIEKFSFEKESKKDFIKSFINGINDIFEQFSINLLIANDQFLPKQETVITEKIVIPVLEGLGDQKREKVNQELSDAISDFHKRDYSGTITKTISSLEVFLQIVLGKKIGEGTFGSLIDEAIKKNKLADDTFTKNIFREFKTIIPQERKNQSDAHPKLKDATANSSILILNLGFISLDHCLKNLPTQTTL